MKQDQTKRMAEILRLSEAIKRTDDAAEHAQDTLAKLHVKRINQSAELRYQKLLLKWHLP